MSRFLVPIYAGVMAVVAVLLARTAITSLSYVIKSLPNSAVLWIILGWSTATLFAPCLSLVILAHRQMRGSLLAHTLFVVCTALVYGSATWVFFAIADNGGENLPAEFAMVASVSLLLLTLLFHAAIMVWLMTSTRPATPNDS